MKENKQTMRLNESQLRQIIKESIKNVLDEQNNVLVQMLLTQIKCLEDYVNNGQYSQALKSAQIISAKINAWIQRGYGQQLNSQQLTQPNQGQNPQQRPMQQN